MTDMVETYLRFVENRHKVWVARQQGFPQPWTDDPILWGKKFTNVFRVLDHGSQFVVRELLYSEPELEFDDALMRCFLYRYTNIPEPWVYFKSRHGYYPKCIDLEGLLQATWTDYKWAGLPVFGTAFKMFVGAENKGVTRLNWILNLTKRYFYDNTDISDTFVMATCMSQRLNILKTIPRCADFMAMQIVTDIGYSPWGEVMHADEDEFVLPGPGAKRGAAHLGWKDATSAIFWAQEQLLELEEPPFIAAPSGNKRYPSLMDVQNTLCEFSKYVRYMDKPLPERPYVPKHPGPQPKPFLPTHW